jgi:hypothetical protein
MNNAASLTRKSTTEAISSGSPERPSALELAPSFAASHSLHAREVPQIALVVRPVAGALRTDIDADGEMAGLRQTTAGRLPDQSVAAGDDRHLCHWFLP